jgi:predicted RNA-binding protein with PIN domain
MSLQYVIDGYNVINHRLFSRIAKKPRGSPASLIDSIKANNLCGSSKNKVAVIFDGYSPAGYLEHPDSRFTIIFSQDRSADEIIKKLAEKATDKKNTLVVSDDREIIVFVRSCGIKITAVEDFIGRHKAVLRQEDTKPELNYSQIAEINEELRKKWLGQK